MKTFIYTLSDPITLKVRYVGKSNNPKKRLYDHLSLCYSTHTHKNNWIKSLLENKTKPILDIIDEVNIDDWQFWEKYWIAKLKENGESLTNHTDGGNGMVKHSYNSIESMRIRHKEFPNYNKSSDKTHIIDKELLYQKYVIENLSLNKCASFFGTAKSTIFHNLKENNITKDKSTWINQVASNPKKVVLQYDLSGNLINEWEGIQVITDSLSINKSNIANCCRGIAISAGGFIWRYKDNFIDINLSKLKRGREVIQFDKSNNRLKSFDSIKEAGLFSGVRANNIQDCCVGRIKSAGGFIWRYKNDIDI